MDEACASARVAQDMKPEAIDILEQDLLHEEAHIKALEVSSLSLARGRRWLMLTCFTIIIIIINRKRDNHPDDDKALDEAREMKQALETKRKRLFLQQEAVRSWWEKIAVQRKAIQKRRLDVNRAKRYVLQALAPLAPFSPRAFPTTQRAAHEHPKNFGARRGSQEAAR